MKSSKDVIQRRHPKTRAGSPAGGRQALFPV
jgi:hypothetical protein